MVLYPEIQRKAQKQIDHIVGTDRLPEFSDREDLPYIDALVSESLRWHPVLPLGEFRFVPPCIGCRLTPRNRHSTSSLL